MHRKAIRRNQHQDVELRASLVLLATVAGLLLLVDQAMVVDVLARICFLHIFKVMSTESAYDADWLPPGT